MTEKFLKIIKNYNLVEKNDCIVLGLSGGADSVSLLHLLIKMRDEYNLTVLAVHVHHGLRGECADNDLEFCRNKCEELNTPFKAYRYNIKEIAAEKGMSIEEAGREKRYEALRNEAKKIGAKIAVAHNMNDQAETLIMRFFRGTGLKGLSGMRPTSNGVIRPLLYITREEIETYCRKNNISYIVDLSNYDTNYTRCNVRQTFLPKIEKEINTNIVETLSRTALILNEENNFLESIAEKYYPLCISEKGVDINELKKTDIALRRRIIRKAVSEVNLKDVSYEHINTVLALMEKPTGKSANLPGGIIVRRNYNYLIVTNACQPENYCYELRPNKVIFIREINMYLSIKVCLEEFCEFSDESECTNFFDYDKIMNTAKLRNRRPGDVIRINGMNKKLKKYFIDEKIPRAERNSIPLIADGENIICIMRRDEPDIYSDTYRITSETKNIMKISLNVHEKFTNN